MRARRTTSGLMWIAAIVVLPFLAFPKFTFAQSEGYDGWVKEPAAVVEGEPGHSYLDPTSTRRGDDGLVYFNESTGITKPEEIGHKGFMKDAYDCARNIKYMCVGSGDWKNDLKSTIKTSNDPALQVYRKYLCGDADPETAGPSE
jgi:hypothetical protein